jgi:hypothetical protein
VLISLDYSVNSRRMNKVILGLMPVIFLFY